MHLYTQARAGNFSGDLGELAKRYSNDFTCFPIGDIDGSRYGLTVNEAEGFYFLIISNCNRPTPNYNFIMAVIGTKYHRTREIMEDFQAGIGIETKEIPEELNEQIDQVQRLLEHLLR